MDHLAAIRTFLRVAAVESFSEAARQLGIPKSLVAKRMNALEQAIGVPLLARSTRRIGLTEHGSLYWQRVSGLVEELDALEGAIGGSHLQLRGLLRVSAPTSFGIQAIGPLLGEFLQRHADITVELLLNDHLVNPAEEGFDVVITDAPEISGQFVEEPLFRFDLLMVAAPVYLQLAGTPQRPAELREHACLHYLYADGGHEWRLGRGEEIERVLVHPRFSTNNGAVLRNAALAGDGIAVLPHFLVDDDLQQGTLVRLFAEYELPRPLMKAVLPKPGGVSPKIRSLIDFLRRRLAQTCPKSGTPDA